MKQIKLFLFGTINAFLCVSVVALVLSSCLKSSVALVPDTSEKISFNKTESECAAFVQLLEECENEVNEMQAELDLCLAKVK